MKALKDYRFLNNNDIRTMGISLRMLLRKSIDFDVYLPSINKNLQRPLVWTLEQKRELIWSVIIGRRIPELSIINRYDDTLEIIDGKQRLSTLIDFYTNKFTIEEDGVEYFLKDLPEEFQLLFESYYINYCEILEWEKPFSDEFKIGWFKQINFAGTPQEKEHLDSLVIRQ